MCSVGRIFLDVGLVVVATLFAHLLLVDFNTSWPRLMLIAPYLVASALAAAVVIPALRLNNCIWRFSSVADYSRIFIAVAGIVCLAVAIGFAVNRLDGVARSLPVMQAMLAPLILIGSRDIRRWCDIHLRSRPTMRRQFAPLNEDPTQTILLVGTTRQTEAYLQSFETLAGDKNHVAGIICGDYRLVGQLFRNHEVLGHLSNTANVLRKLGTHGVQVDRIVLTERLDEDAHHALAETARQTGLMLEIASQSILPGSETIVSARKAVSLSNVGDAADARFVLPPELTSKLSQRPYWRLKRCTDVIGAAVLIVVLLPLYAITALLVAIDVGLPILFWQRRPGLGGRAFRVFKFRTMQPQHSADGQTLEDPERTSSLGALIRQQRLDELPQLFAILSGQMSFVGPRPLLAEDQPSTVRSRLLIRPGLTGWAQVAGGRLISPMDKAALDLWYIQNANLLLDIKIVLKTVAIVLWGEHRQYDLIAEAWEDLHQAGIVQYDHERGALMS